MNQDPLAPWRDDKAFIVQNHKYGGDPGDTANRHGVMFTFASRFAHQDEQGNFYFWTDEFIHESGQVIRHPHGLKPWTRELNRSSRDQNIPWIAGLVIHSAVKRIEVAGRVYEGYPYLDPLKRIYKAVKGNYSRFHNYYKNGHPRTAKPHNKWYQIDIAGPEIWSMFLRGIPSLNAFSGLRYLTDLHLLIDTILWNWVKPDSDNDIVQHLCILKACVDVKPTVVSRVALKLLDKPKAIKKVKQYYDFEGYSLEPLKDQVPIGEMVIKWLEKQ